MKHPYGAAAVAALGVIAAFLAATPASAVDGPHNLNSTAPGGRPCVACHTPHRSVQTHLLWNHTLSGNTFTWSDMTETTGGTPLPTNLKTWSGSTKLCLSCHDGSVSIGSTYWPGSVWNSTKVTGDELIASVSGDLKGNHPVGVPYPYGGVKNTYNGLTTGNNALASGWVSSPTGVKLLNDPAAGSSNNKGIECASCHDVHNDAIGDYLRVSAGTLCQSCHTK